MAPQLSDAQGAVGPTAAPFVFKLARRCKRGQHEQYWHAASRPGEERQEIVIACHSSGVTKSQNLWLGIPGLRGWMSSAIRMSSRGRCVSARHEVLIGSALHELNLDAEFLRRLLDLGLEKQVIDETEDARGRVVADGNGSRRGLVKIRKIAAVTIAGDLDGRCRPVGDVAVDRAVAVIHRSDEFARAALLLLALALWPPGSRVSGL